MKSIRYILPALVAGGAALLTFPSGSSAFNVIGGINRNANQIGFQVYQTSFTDAASNNNVTADTNFPGATGAAMALWKAACEWNSELRGNNGNGDPLQPGGLGSGGSNYDYMYHGTVTSVGSNENNVISATTSSLGAGVFAVTFYSIPGAGWQMLFDNSPTNNWNWVDGPGNETGGLSTDIEGIGVHELGHGLGLAHSSDPSATMFATTTPGGSVGGRTIETDDINGIQSIYGAKSASKPKITGVTGNIYTFGIITITGTNFDPTSNDIWFSKDYAGSPEPGGTPPTPVVVSGIPSTGGTSISVQVPLGVIAGDIIVRKQGANGDQTLKSAPFPFRLQAPPPFPVIGNFSPSTIAIASSASPNILTINGIGFSSTTSVTIGSRTYGAGQFQIVNANQLKVDFNPPPLEVGSVNVTVTNSFGTSPALPVNITLSTGNFMFLDKTIATAGSNVTLYACAPTPGEFPGFCYSTCIGTLDLSPYFILGIGGCGDLGFVEGQPLLNAAGVSEIVQQVPPTFHGVAFLQYVRLNIINLQLPSPVSNVVTLIVP
jgi:hypothetical protein